MSTINTLLSINRDTFKNSILVVNARGQLIRLECPFWVVVLKNIDVFVIGDLTLVESINGYTGTDLIYVINDKHFKYYLFQIEET